MYTMNMLRLQGKAACPVPGCAGPASTPAAMRLHFANRHPADSVHILQEGLVPFEKCAYCRVQIAPQHHSARHRTSAQCKAQAAKVQQREAWRELQRVRDQTFTIYGRTLPTTSTFKYLGRPMSTTDSDWPAVFRNLTRARQKWVRASKILGQQGADPVICGHLYIAVVQSLLLYGSETWVVTPQMLTLLDGFHHRCTRRIAGMAPKFDVRTNSWSKPPIEEAFALTKLKPLAEYIQKRQNHIAEYVALRPIYSLCTQSVRRSGSTNRTLWWTQPSVQEYLSR